jgi:hypothetical protein
MGASPVPDIAGIYGSPEKPRQAATVSPAFGYAGGGGQALMSADALFQGLKTAHAWRETQKLNAIQANWEMANRAYESLQKDWKAAQDANDPRAPQLYAAMTQAYQQRKQAYDEASQFWTPEGKAGGKKTAAGGAKGGGKKEGGPADQHGSKMESLKRIFHEIMVGPEPTLPNVPPYGPTEAPGVPNAPQVPGAVAPATGQSTYNF